MRGLESAVRAWGDSKTMPEMKAPSDSGESVSESSESEETKMVPATSRQQQQRAEADDDAEEEGESETDGDDETGGARLDAVNRDGFSVAKGAATVEQPAAKRGRDVNGRVEESGEKRKKDGKEEKTRGQQSAKSASPVKPVKTTRLKTEKASAVDAVKADSAKPQTRADRKREPSPVPMSSARHKTSKKEKDRISPSKVKKATAHWSSNREETLTSLMLRDKSNGLPIPISRSDGYWGRLLKRLLPSIRDLTEAQLFDKVKRMRSRYHFMNKKFTDAGVTTFNNAHEEQMFQTWEGIWGPGMSAAARGAASQPATKEEDSDERSEGTASPAGDVKGATVQVGGDEEVEKDEDGDEDAENTKRKTAGLNKVGAAAKGVVTPFPSKPRLEFTPRPPRNKHRKAEDVMGGDHGTGAASAGNDGGQREIDSLLFEQVKQLRAETLAFFQKMRGTSFHSAEDIPRLGSLPGGLASFSFGQGFGNGVGTMENIVNGGGNDGALRLQKKCRELEIKELALFSGRLEVLQEQCRMRQEELQNSFNGPERVS